MVGKCVNKFATVPSDVTNSTVTQLNETATGHLYSPVEIATLVCFMVGVIQVKSFQGNSHCKALTNLNLLYSF